MRLALLMLMLVLPLLTACASRRVEIDSEPRGAVVFVNDVEVGRTPCSFAFRFYGRYDVRLEKEGFEPLRTKADANAPIYEYPPLDVATEASPVRVRTTRRWKFELLPTLESTLSDDELERGLIERARQLQADAERGAR